MRGPLPWPTAAPRAWLLLVCACTGWLGCARREVELFDAPPVDASRRFQCGSHPCACANGADDDGDGASDGLDDGCTFALDDDEASWDLLRSMGECLDCAFDDNDGADEGCRHPETCLTGGVPMGMGCGGCGLDADCVAGCRPRVPNGCDCFGCCAIEDGARTAVVLLGPGCTRATLDDPSVCSPCTPAEWCMNPCERCERCPGRETLPADCTPTCGDGQTSCTTAAECGVEEACVLGCCLVAS